MPDEIQKEVMASIELDAEKVSFNMPDGEVFKLQLRTILEKGDTPTALQYANLIMLRTVAEKQGELAMALNAMANAVRGMVPQQSTAGFSPNAVEDLVGTMFDRMTNLFEAAGMKPPKTGE